MLFKPFAGKLVQPTNLCTFFVLLVVFWAAQFWERKTGKVRDPFHGILEAELFMLLDELEYVPGGTTGKALINAQTRVNVHRRTAVVVEGADPKVAPVPRTFQRHKIFNDQRNVCVGLELLNDFV